MKRPEIIPAILPKDFAELQEKIDLIKDFVKAVQIDVCDGQFTPQPSWPYRKPDTSFKKIITEEDGLPGWEKLNFEIDLMVNRPAEKVEQWVQAGATRIIVHAEATGDVIRAIDMLHGRVEVGIAFNIETDPTDFIAKVYHAGFSVDCVQLMGIDHIGFQGQAFDDKVIERIQEVIDLRGVYGDLPISVDGGVSLETAPKLIAAGADRLVVGSAIFESDNYVDAVTNFKKLGH